MENTTTTAEEKPDMVKIAGQIKEYAETKVEIMKLTLAGKSARTLSRASSKSIFGFLLVMGLVFGSCALGLFIHELTGRASLAFLAVAVLYVLAAIVYRLFLGRKIEAKLDDWYIKQILGDEQEQHK